MHLCFNVIGTAVWLSVFVAVSLLWHPALLGQVTTPAGIAVAHSLFNLACVALLLPMTGLLERLAMRLIPDAKAPEQVAELDERLLAAPALALERSRALTEEMAECAVQALEQSLSLLGQYRSETAREIREAEDRTDHYEDLLGSYLVRLSAVPIGEDASAEAASLLRMIGDFERIADHAVNLTESAEELRDKGLTLSDAARRDLKVLLDAVREILTLTLRAFCDNDVTLAHDLKEQLRSRHIRRLQRGRCSIEAGFVWSDLLTDLERVSDHCSNIAGCLIDAAQHALHLHESLREARAESPEFAEEYARCRAVYALPPMDDAAISAPVPEG